MNFAALYKAFDAVMMLRDAAKHMKGPAPAGSRLAQVPVAEPGDQLEARMGAVVVAALKEVFDRDRTRLEFERAEAESHRRRAEEALRLELRRQSVDREIGRLRLLAGTALVGWLFSVGVLVVFTLSPSSRTVLACGWVLLLGALAAAFSAQGSLARLEPSDHRPPDMGRTGTASLWLLVAGLATTAFSLLM